jgi:hypothetical protein
MKHVKPGVTLAVAALAMAACEQAKDPAAPNDFEFAPAFAFSPGAISAHEAWVCKDGPNGYTYDFTAEGAIGGGTSSLTYQAGVTVDNNNPLNGTFSIVGAGCLKIAEGSGASIVVTELTEPAGTVFKESQLYTYQTTTAAGGDTGTPSPIGSPTNSRSVTMSPIGQDWAQLALFVNELEPPPPPPPANGRMTGGGAQIDVGVAKITRGFTIHCDLTLSNNLEINWDKNQWHIEKPLTAATCTDDPNIDQAPPRAPFDTFVGEGYGRLNGVDGSFVRFTFVDAGEPGKNDSAAIQIWAPGADPSVDAPYLDIGGLLTHGNIQAHYDQPHSGNGNK